MLLLFTYLPLAVAFTTTIFALNFTLRKTVVLYGMLCKWIQSQTFHRAVRRPRNFHYTGSSSISMNHWFPYYISQYQQISRTVRVQSFFQQCMNVNQGTARNAPPVSYFLQLQTIRCRFASDQGCTAFRLESPCLPSSHISSAIRPPRINTKQKAYRLYQAHTTRCSKQYLSIGQNTPNLFSAFHHQSCRNAFCAYSQNGRCNSKHSFVKYPLRPLRRRSRQECLQVYKWRQGHGAEQEEKSPNWSCSLKACSSETHWIAKRTCSPQRAKRY